MRESADPRAGAIIDVVIDLIETDGYDAVQIRTVARRARVSMATIYNLFQTRDELVVSALERWMDDHAYATLTMPEPDDPPYETMVRILRTVFKPWERQPRVLQAYHRARNSPSGRRLDAKGRAIVGPIVEAALTGTDPQYLRDVGLIHGHVVRAVIARFADGEISMAEVLPILERTLFRLTTDNRLDTVRSPQRGSPEATPSKDASGSDLR